MPKSRAIAGIDEDIKLNKALWCMAEVLSKRRSRGTRVRRALFTGTRNIAGQR
jgi:hypothetical protein